MMQLFGWGANSHGQLGMGIQSEQTISPEIINLNNLKLNASNIEKIIGGAGHTMILDKSGRIHSCGWNHRGQTGIPGSEVVLHFQTVDSLKDQRIIDITCGWDSSLALNECGEVYGWGSNVYGQLGIPASEALSGSNKPQRIHIHAKVKKIAMGLRHSAAVTVDGEVLTTGAGNKGQLGIVDERHSKITALSAFTLVPNIKEVIDVACGQYFTVALTRHGDIYTWGDNKYGQLGVDSNKIRSSSVPIKLDKNFGDIQMIATGWTHATILTAQGRIFSWGRGIYHQLGYADSDCPTWQPRIIESITAILQLALGSEHNIAIDEFGRLFSWGWNEHGNCGNGATENVVAPQQIFIQPQKNIIYQAIMIGSGAAHSFAIVKSR